ncbi:Pre-small/secreted glycoprotein [Trichinella pseudospiralis]
MLHLDDDISSSICRANWIYRVKETNPDKLTKGWLVLYKNGLLEFKDDQSHDWIFLGNVVAEKKYFFKCDSMQEKFFWLIDLGLIIRQITAKDGNDALNDVFDTDAIYDAQHQLKYVLFCCLVVFLVLYFVLANLI